MTDFPRLIEHAFPLKQTSLDSVHEKNVRHGHISTLHIWPARRPLAACRAALIATLLPDPGTPEKRRELCDKIGGRLVKKIERKKMPGGRVVEREKEVTKGGVLHWHGQPRNKADRDVIQQQQDDLQWFREEIKRVYGRAPKVLDPFAGGGAIPLEAMRLGCEATAVDINPVAWFILKCTLEYPQKLAGQTRELPEFILHDDEFMRDFFVKAKGYSRAEAGAAISRLHTRLKKRPRRGKDIDDPGLLFGDADADQGDELHADLAWHVRAWGQWVLTRARKELARYYPVYADWEPLKKGVTDYERQHMRLVPLKDDGTPDIDALNEGLSKEYLSDKRNPRWVAKPTVAYLWARTVTCKNCRAEIPLLKTRWLCKKDNKRVLLAMTPRAHGTGVDFGIETDVPKRGGNTAQRREHDKQIGKGTMTRAGAECPCCSTITATADIQTIGQSSGLPEVMTCAVVDGQRGREYREIREEDRAAWASATDALASAAERDQFGMIHHPIDPRRPSPNSRGLSGLTKYGIRTFAGVFNARQQLGLFTYAHLASAVYETVSHSQDGCEWAGAIADLLSLPLGKLADYNSRGCTWNLSREGIGHTFTRFALPMTTDYAEANLTLDAGGGFLSAVEYASAIVERIMPDLPASSRSAVVHGSATTLDEFSPDVIVTDPPYYDSIPYADISDYFYIWLRRAAGHRYPEQFASELVPREGELVQHAGRLDGDNVRAKEVYEDGMAAAFHECFRVLSRTGRLVIVFAHKQPDAWETLASALIRAGFVVESSWPIQTERDTRFTSLTGSGLASSVWLVCKKRPEAARPGWDKSVLEEMQENIAEQLREFWDAGIRGPDFIWAATGPALEAYSKHPIVKKANDPGQTMTVSEFLGHVRRIVVDYIVGQVLSGGEAGESDVAVPEQLDEPTTYYMLHRSDFGFDDAPVGACILYATACSLSDRDLADQWDLVNKVGGKTASDDDDIDADADPDDDEEVESPDSGGKLKLKTWAQRKGKNMGYEAPSGRRIPLIDRVHRLMHLWRAGDVHKVDEYLDEQGLRRHELFRQLIQSLIELSRRDRGKEETALLESLSNHLGIRGAVRDRGPELFAQPAATGSESV